MKRRTFVQTMAAAATLAAQGPQLAHAAAEILEEYGIAESAIEKPWPRTNASLGIQTAPFPAIGKHNAVTQDLCWPAAILHVSDRLNEKV